jgi:hypothetical protein
MAHLTDVQFVTIVASLALSRAGADTCGSPIVVNGLDNKTQRRTDTVHILIHDLLDDCRLPSII